MSNESSAREEMKALLLEVLMESFPQVAQLQKDKEAEALDASAALLEGEAKGLRLEADKLRGTLIATPKGAPIKPISRGFWQTLRENPMLLGLLTPVLLEAIETLEKRLRASQPPAR